METPPNRDPSHISSKTSGGDNGLETQQTHAEALSVPKHQSVAVQAVSLHCTALLQLSNKDCETIPGMKELGHVDGDWNCSVQGPLILEVESVWEGLCSALRNDAVRCVL